MKTAKEILKGAKDVLQERGWCKNTFICPDGKVCADGALRIAAGAGVEASDGKFYIAYVPSENLDGYHDAQRLAGEAAHDKAEADACDWDVYGVVQYNDKCAKSGDDIQAVFDAALVQAEALI